MKSVRCSFTFPKTLHDDLTTISRGLGVSRSAILTNALGDSLHVMAEAITEFHAHGSTPEAALRLRGESVHKVDALYREFVDAIEHAEIRS